MVDVDDVRLQMEAIWHIFMLLILIQLSIPFYFSFSSSHYHWLVPHVTPYTHGPSSISPFLYFILNFRVFYARSLFFSSFSPFVHFENYFVFLFSFMSSFFIFLFFFLITFITFLILLSFVFISLPYTILYPREVIVGEPLFFQN